MTLMVTRQERLSSLIWNQQRGGVLCFLWILNKRYAGEAGSQHIVCKSAFRQDWPLTRWNFPSQRLSRGLTATLATPPPSSTSTTTWWNNNAKCLLLPDPVLFFQSKMFLVLPQFPSWTRQCSSCRCDKWREDLSGGEDAAQRPSQTWSLWKSWCLEKKL